MLDELFRPHLSTLAREYFMALMQIKEINGIQIPSLTMGMQMDLALVGGGAIILKDVDDRRRKGSVDWVSLFSKPFLSWCRQYRELGMSNIFKGSLSHLC